MTDELAQMPVIDIDTHWTEPPDLWTSHAPAKLRDRALRTRRNADEADPEALETWLGWAYRPNVLRMKI
ncbi:MAG: hypothetical protein CL933_12380 [Deltaproteobacteria bacterium]|nr:hypothetical protein [Deltaproteobacteria bacterium]